MPPFGSRTVDTADPVSARLVYETWRLVDALPSPRTVCVHAEFFVTADGEIVLCEVAARIGGGPIPTDAPSRSGNRPARTMGSGGMRVAD